MKKIDDWLNDPGVIVKNPMTHAYIDVQCDSPQRKKREEIPIAKQKAKTKQKITFNRLLNFVKICRLIMKELVK